MSHATNTNVTPLNVAYPGTIVSGDILLMAVGCTTAGAVFTNSDITSSLHSRATNGQVELFAKIADGTETGNVTVSADQTTRVHAAIACFSGGPASLVSIAHTTGNAGGSGTHVPFGAMTITQDNCLVLLVGRKNINWTSAGDVSNFTELTESNASTQSMVWNYWIQTTQTNVSAGQWSITGDSSGSRNSIGIALLPGSALSNAPRAERQYRFQRG